MEFDSRRSDDPVVEFAFLAPHVFPYIRFVIGSEYFADLEARYLFHPARCNSSFGGLSPVAGVVVSFLPCSIRIERLRSPEYLKVMYFGDLAFLLIDRTVVVSFSGVSSVFREFPFGLIYSINDGPISDLLVASFID
ncbi:hypothetical protein F2Q69_00022055 [Brassica cretica]|uniref:Uncharacterized protein n=1 Tax=Brassica cretica TaxID=69181 RepID=A0A8S9QK87_BRACR|nr:hypothetical protein F2Q69_00022055 [Brassica cretica]